MEQHRRDLLAARVLSGTVRLRVDCGRGGPTPLLLLPATREQRYLAEEVYQEAHEEASLGGCHTEESLLDFLYGRGLWDEGGDELLRRLEKDIEDFKVKLVESEFRSNERRAVRKALAVARGKQGEAAARRHAYDHLTCDGAASMARTRFLVAARLAWPDRSPVFPPLMWEEPCGPLAESALEEHVACRVTDEEFRELARTEPVRGVWAAARACGGSVFGVAAADLTDEQTRLCFWSALYDNVCRHPECPPDEVLEDDDMLDGWLIVQRRKRGDGGKGRDLPEGQEVFLMADTPEDAAKIDALNDEGSRRVKRQREELVRRRGQVQHADLPDVRLYCQMEAAKQMAAGVKG